MSLASTIAGIVVAFVNNWKLSLLTMGFIPAMAVVGSAIHVVRTRCCSGGGRGGDGGARAPPRDAAPQHQHVIAAPRCVC